MTTDEGRTRRSLHLEPNEDDPVERINAMIDRAGQPGRAEAQARAELHQEYLEFGKHHWLWQLCHRAPGKCRRARERQGL